MSTHPDDMAREERLREVEREEQETERIQEWGRYYRRQGCDMETAARLALRDMLGKRDDTQDWIDHYLAKGYSPERARAMADWMTL